MKDYLVDNDPVVVNLFGEELPGLSLGSNWQIPDWIEVLVKGELLMLPRSKVTFRGFKIGDEAVVGSQLVIIKAVGTKTVKVAPILGNWQEAKRVLQVAHSSVHYDFSEATVNYARVCFKRTDWEKGLK
jgi:hypothetical protein